MNKIIKKLPLLALILFSLSACGGGSAGGSGYSGTAIDSYSYVSDLPEGLYVTFSYPYTDINSIHIRESSGCVEVFAGDCDVFSGDPDNLPFYEIFYVTTTGKYYYMLSDLSDNTNLYQEYTYDMELVSYNLPAHPSVVYDNWWVFSETNVTDKRVWVVEVDGVERELFVRNNTVSSYDYALIRFTDTTVYNEFLYSTFTVDDVNANLQHFFEPASAYYYPYSWSYFTNYNIEVLDVYTIGAYQTQVVEAVPPGLTCVVPLYNGYLNAETGLSGCMFKTDEGVNYVPQFYRQYDLDITYAMSFPY